MSLISLSLCSIKRPCIKERFRFQTLYAFVNLIYISLFISWAVCRNWICWNLFGSTYTNQNIPGKGEFALNIDISLVFAYKFVYRCQKWIHILLSGLAKWQTKTNVSQISWVNSSLVSCIWFMHYLCVVNFLKLHFWFLTWM